MQTVFSVVLFWVLSFIFLSKESESSFLRCRLSAHTSRRYALHTFPLKANSEVMDSTFDDMKVFAFILANITEHLDTAPELAFSTASREMGWLLARNVTKLAQILIDEFPVIRDDTGMQRAYSFLIDFLDLVSAETKTLMDKNRKILRKIMEATKRGQQEFDDVIQLNKKEMTSSEFLVYLDSEIDNQESGSAMENFLVTIKLRLLDEIGSEMGVGVQSIPKLMSYSDPDMIKLELSQHLSTYDQSGKLLFLQTVRIIQSEMKKRYKQVDPQIIKNLQLIDDLTSAEVRDTKES